MVALNILIIFRRPRPEARFAVDLLALLQGRETALDKRERWQQTQLDWEQSLVKSLLSHFRENVLKPLHSHSNAIVEMAQPR